MNNELSERTGEASWEKRKQHPKLCCKSQQEKPLAVEELEDMLKKDVDLESVSEIKTTMPQPRD